MAAPARLLALLRGPFPRRSRHEWAPARDVLLFEHERSRFSAALGLFCAGQGVFWASLAWAAAAGPGGPRAGGAEQAEPAGQAGRRGPGETLRRYGLAGGCGAAGALVLGAGLLFSLRSVRSVRLLAGGEAVTLTTHAPPGLRRSLTVPLSHVSCVAPRGEVRALLPLKVKGRRFYFLLDKAGHFPDAPLFDRTVGAHRSL